LLNELRVALPGVQVLFAFLLTLPFTQRFGQLTVLQRNVYFATFCAAILATVLLMTPTAYHRLRFRRHDKERMLRISNRTAIAGIGSLAIAICGAAYLISDVLFGAGGAAATAIATAVLLVVLWFVLPLMREVPED
jgi:predicted neutral ceramidase superfamily lipid hydrolase